MTQAVILAAGTGSRCKPLTDDEKSWMNAVVDQTIDRTFMKRYGTIDEQVNAILFLASDESSYITGSTIPVGGVYRNAIKKFFKSNSL